ncbi:S-adenosylmethionine-dependent methyltransferase [Aspergillus affinis]|uniref:S-adenosylmethionine-dependent methyltransferase n=1 Tax=Aspergillus affinis TaxID=1070780 RepID=UPI0022FE433F|nr:SET domain-containing protein [Aspergillus affinis]KAI9036710.1 SET domain-containing protein [Aspergillus affinis]
MSLTTEFPSVSTKANPGQAPGGLGKGLFASTSLKTGEDVLSIQNPFVAVLETPRLDDTCSGCFGKRQLENVDAALKACTGCQVVKYCDRTCQSKDWKAAHSLECSIYQKLKPRVLPINARAVLRIVLRSQRQKCTPQEMELFLQLETHVQEIQRDNPAQLERIGISAKAVKVYSGTDMKEETISAFGAKLDLNSFNMTNPLYDQIGLYLHPFAALINHSCDYNSVVGFDGHQLFVKAIRPIQKDEQIFISYIDTTNPYKIRRAELRERYYFDCRCPKCEQGLDGPADKFPNTSSSSPADPSDLEADGKEAQKILDRASALDTDPVESIIQLESAMRWLRRTSPPWPITRQPYISLRDQLITSLLAAGSFSAAFIHCAIRHLRIDPVVYPHASHPVRCLHAWTLAKLTIHLSQDMEPSSSSSSGDAIPLDQFGLNFSLVIWSVLSDLVNREAECCTAPSFKGMVRGAFAEVHNEFRVNGLDPRTMGGDIRREWEKMGRLVDLAVGKE